MPWARRSSQIRSQPAGFEHGIKVDGGGVFGVINESNWEVCDQTPAAGQVVSEAPRLTVDRSCSDDADPSERRAEPEEPDPAESSQPDVDQVLTPVNNDEFAALLTVPDYCDETIARFAAEYGGRTIRFAGSISAMDNHGDYDTRYDILVSPGNKGPNSTVGPAFKFENVNVADLNLTGAKVPDAVGEGDRFRFVAQVGKYNRTQCLLFLAPVSTTVR